MNQDRAYITFGQEKDVKIFRDDTGALRLDASTIDFLAADAEKITINGERLVPAPVSDENECLINNGGCHLARDCHNTVGSFECADCKAGWENDGPLGCKDIDECRDKTKNGGCDPKRKCVNLLGSMECADCSTGYANDGDKGCKDIDECQTANGGCHLERKCTNTDGSLICEDCAKGHKNVGDKGCKETNMVLDGDADIPEDWITGSNKKKLGKLLFKASKDGWDAYNDFHSKCDDQGTTLTVVRSPEGYIYGGYTEQSWREYGGNYRTDERAWLFWIKCRAQLKPRKMMVKMDGNQGHAIYPHNSYGPTFGGGHDIYFEGGNMRRGYVNWGHTYPLPSGYGTEFLTGIGGASTHDMAEEIEVWKVM